MSMTEFNAIWDAVERISRAEQKLIKINRLRSDISAMGTQCGDCSKWMKSRECPREKNVHGRNHGPSMNTPVCSQFVESAWATSHRENLKTQVSALRGV